MNNMPKDWKNKAPVNDPPGQVFRLVPRGGPGLSCDDDGVALGPISLANVIATSDGPCIRRRSASEFARALKLAYVETDEGSVRRRERGVARVAELLAAGDGVRARMHAVLLAFPKINDSGMKKLAHACALQKFNPNWASEARVPPGEEHHGEWTRTGGNSPPDAKKPSSASSAGPKKKNETLEDIRAKKQRFVDEHLVDAQKAADQLHVPVENVLGISAKESGWGGSRFATKGDNYFGLYYPAPFATGALPAAKNPKARLARFANYADCVRAFIRIAGPYVSNKADPASFAAAAQDSGKFGIDPTTGKKEKDYVSKLAKTISGLRPYVRERVAP